MLYKHLPYFIFRRLFGDRRRFGAELDETDSDYRIWKENYLRFYTDNQKGAIGSVVNRWGFSIIRGMDFTGKRVLELGPGIIEHTCFFSTRPEAYFLVDTDPQFLKISGRILEAQGFRNIATLEMNANRTDIPLESSSVDVVLSFHQLEHVFELERHLAEIRRVLKPGGVLAGAVPAEGSLAWGLGRFFTSRRYVKKNMKFNYDKIICWEHPNFLDKISTLLSAQFEMERAVKKPFPFLPADMNLSYSFICRNSGVQDQNRR